jgi:acyl-CoA hydrolase
MSAPDRVDGDIAGANAQWVTDVLEPGDLVVVGQGVGEPTPLLEQLARAGGSLRDTEVFVGLSHSSALTDVPARSLSLVSFGAMGPLARRTASEVAIIPCHFADVARVLPHRAPGRLVVLIQVSAPDGDGYHSMGMAVDFTYELVAQARAVVAEVNEQMPVTSAPRLPSSVFAATVGTSRPLPVVPPPTVQEVHRRIAAHVAELVPDSATIQLGIGSVPSVVGEALRGRRELRVHSTLVGDWLLGLADSGALRNEPGAVVISEAAGSPALYDYVAGSAVLVRPVRELTRPDVLAGIDRFVAMNSALQVDLSGQVNAEEIESGYVGGIGGQPDFLRAAQRSPGGRAIIMLPATTARGEQSRIVHRLHHGTVTTPRSGVDFAVTEFGVADLRGKSLDERAQALIAVAAPQHRDALRAAS